jgi:hypothetical protein
MRSSNKVLVYSELRPPVAARDGESPLRDRAQRRIFESPESVFNNRVGFAYSKEQLAANIQDDGKLVDPNWNRRHHVIQSAFND